MRYSKEHKAETHARIVAKAAVRLRERGVHGVGVADLMKDAGLTHGGFYAHFSSREALVIEAFTRAMDASMRNWRKLASEAAPGEALSSLIGNYLTPQHRDAPGHGCAVPTLGGDIVRESPKTRRAFAAKVEEMAGLIGEQLRELPPDEARQEALGIMATMVGALLLSRIGGSGNFSEAVLEAGRKTLEKRQAVLRAEASPQHPRSARPAKA